MTGADRTAPSGRPTRLLAVLALLLGLLAMHGLASAHHAPASAAGPAAGAGAAHAGVGGAPHGTHQPAGRSVPDVLHAATVALPGDVTSAGAVGDVCPDCVRHGAGVLCVAILSAGLALLVRLLAHRAGSGGAPPSPGRPSPETRTGRLRLPRPPDLVAGLCVSRT